MTGKGSGFWRKGSVKNRLSGLERGSASPCAFPSVPFPAPNYIRGRRGWIESVIEPPAVTGKGLSIPPRCPDQR
jgi:hypothetical protein